MIATLVGTILGLYALWYLRTAGGRYPMFFGPKWHDEQARLHQEEKKRQETKEANDRADLAKRIAEEMRKEN